jgi:DNA-binding NtrC family response regulator
LSPEAESVSDVGSRCLVLRLENLEEDPTAIGNCLTSLAEEEGLLGSLHPVIRALGALPCPGNLRGLRNRLVRWKLLGQLPEPLDDSSTHEMGALEAEDLATNLHQLERLLLHRALRRSFGNRVEAAHRLGISRRQLYLLIGRHGDPLRGEIPTHPGPQRFLKRQVKTS